MKKFFTRLVIFLVILILVGGTAFVFGWANLFVPPGSVAVASSKTSGIIPQAVESGKFCWLWQRLIPTNVKMLVFNPKPFTQSIDISGALPSGDVYAAFESMDGTKANTDFSYRIAGTAGFSLKTGSLPGIVEKQRIEDQAGLDAYCEKLGSDISAFIKEKLLTAAAQTDSLQQLLAKNGAGEAANIEQAVLAAYPALENVTINLQTVKLPDFKLYAQVSSLYQKYLDYQAQTLDKSVAEGAKNHISSQMDIDELSRYGELFSKYPQLLDYLKIKAQ